MKTLIVGVLVMAVVLLLPWCWVYDTYDTMQEKANTAYHAGDSSGMMNELTAYENHPASYPFRSFKFFELFKSRLAYMKGVALAHSGDDTGADSNFRTASQSKEVTVAVSALYNGAEYRLRRGELESARGAYEDALKRTPNDIQAKINLELLIQKINEQKAKGDNGDPMNGNDNGYLSDYWLRQMPQQEGPDSGTSRRIWQ